jgi:hypothetical protein
MDYNSMTDEEKRIYDEEFHSVMSEYDGAMKSYYAVVNVSNERMLKAIKNQLGESFYKSLMSYLDDCGTITGKFEIVNRPYGDFQNESYGKIKGVWVNQSSGYSGDDYSGNIYILLKGTYVVDNKKMKVLNAKSKAKFLSIPYAC